MYTLEMAKTGPKPIPWQDRAMRRISPEPNSGCWLWEGAQNGVGYGVIGVSDGGTHLVHRKMWEHANGPVPDSMWVLHRCDIRACCNPDHLFLGTPQDNMDDMHGKGRFVARGNEEFCKNGHPLTEDNRRSTAGGKKCRICWNAYMRRYHAAKRQA
jgi:hypothetical protein